MLRFLMVEVEKSDKSPASNVARPENVEGFDTDNPPVPVTESPPVARVSPALRVDVALTVRVCAEPLPRVVFPWMSEAFDTVRADEEALVPTCRNVVVAYVVVDRKRERSVIDEEAFDIRPALNM
jgi:hypothetical protein